ncbi:conserved hypothetical protein [Tenacibaculum litoreum]|jgi:hypothetical protein|uniref:hypothetical protein n=1 Tax=Tenacibaculum TaxID=104267 RepID=UPI003894EB11
MKKVILNVEGSQELTKTTLKNIKGGGPFPFPKECGGDGSYIYQDGVKVCCYQPSTMNYIC